MKFIVSSSVLLKNIQNINGVGSNNPVIPILENFLFRNTTEGAIVSIQVDEKQPLKISSDGITAVILIKELFSRQNQDDIDEMILEIYKDNKRIHSTHHYDFERIVRRLFVGLGYDVIPTKRTRDGGYDMVATLDGVIPTRHLVECKTSKSKPLGIEVVERFLFKISDLKASTGVMVTNLKFSADVIKKYATDAYKHSLKLIDGLELLLMIKKYTNQFFGTFY